VVESKIQNEFKMLLKINWKMALKQKKRKLKIKEFKKL